MSNIDRNEVLVYTIVVDNVGPGAAFNVKVTCLIGSDGEWWLFVNR